MWHAGQKPAVQAKKRALAARLTPRATCARTILAPRGSGAPRECAGRARRAPGRRPASSTTGSVLSRAASRTAPRAAGSGRSVAGPSSTSTPPSCCGRSRWRENCCGCASRRACARAAGLSLCRALLRNACSAARGPLCWRSGKAARSGAPCEWRGSDFCTQRWCKGRARSGALHRRVLECRTTAQAGAVLDHLSRRRAGRRAQLVSGPTLPALQRAEALTWDRSTRASKYRAPKAQRHRTAIATMCTHDLARDSRLLGRRCILQTAPEVTDAHRACWLLQTCSTSLCTNFPRNAARQRRGAPAVQPA